MSTSPSGWEWNQMMSSMPTPALRRTRISSNGFRITQQSRPASRIAHRQSLKWGNPYKMQHHYQLAWRRLRFLPIITEHGPYASTRLAATSCQLVDVSSPCRKPAAHSSHCHRAASMGRRYASFRSRHHIYLEHSRALHDFVSSRRKLHDDTMCLQTRFTQGTIWVLSVDVWSRKPNHQQFLSPDSRSPSSSYTTLCISIMSDFLQDLDVLKFFMFLCVRSYSNLPSLSSFCPVPS